MTPAPAKVALPLSGTGLSVARALPAERRVVLPVDAMIAV